MVARARSRSSLRREDSRNGIGLELRREDLVGVHALGQIHYLMRGGNNKTLADTGNR